MNFAVGFESIIDVSQDNGVEALPLNLKMRQGRLGWKLLPAYGQGLKPAWNP